MKKAVTVLLLLLATVLLFAFAESRKQKNVFGKSRFNAPSKRRAYDVQSDRNYMRNPGMDLRREDEEEEYGLARNTRVWEANLRDGFDEESDEEEYVVGGKWRRGGKRNGRARREAGRRDKVSSDAEFFHRFASCFWGRCY